MIFLIFFCCLSSAAIEVCSKLSASKSDCENCGAIGPKCVWKSHTTTVAPQTLPGQTATATTTEVDAEPTTEIATTVNGNPTTVVTSQSPVSATTQTLALLTDATTVAAATTVTSPPVVTTKPVTAPPPTNAPTPAPTNAPTPEPTTTSTLPPIDCCAAELDPCSCYNLTPTRCKCAVTMISRSLGKSLPDGRRRMLFEETTVVNSGVCDCGDGSNNGGGGEGTLAFTRGEGNQIAASGSISVPAIAGGVAGGVVLLALIGVIVCLATRRPKTAKGVDQPYVVYSPASVSPVYGSSTAVASNTASLGVYMTPTATQSLSASSGSLYTAPAASNAVNSGEMISVNAYSAQEQQQALMYSAPPVTNFRNSAALSESSGNYAAAPRPDSVSNEYAAAPRVF